MATKQQKQADESTADSGEDFTADQEAAKSAPAPGQPTEDPAYDPDQDKADNEAAAAEVASEGVKHTDPMPKKTRLDEHNDAPSVTVPGDGPADTWDPTERASTVGGDKRAAAAAGHLTVNAAIPLPRHETDTAGGAEAEHRVERYPATRPDGTVVTVTHNLDTGETKVSDGAE